MKKTIILFATFFALILSGLNTQTVAVEKSTLSNSLFIQENDPGLEIEEWMLENKYWSSEKQETSIVQEEQDKSLELESWMLESSYWN